MSIKPLLSEDVCWHCQQRTGSQAEATRLERSYRLTSEALVQSQEDLHKALSEIERLKALLSAELVVDDDFEINCTCGLPVSDPGHQAQHQRVLAESDYEQDLSCSNSERAGDLYQT